MIRRMLKKAAGRVRSEHQPSPLPGPAGPSPVTTTTPPARADDQRPSLGIAASLARAASAEPRTTPTPAETPTRRATDGAAFWGPVDNDSARAKARGQTLIIDQEECINCGTCVENAEGVFVLPNDAAAAVVSQEGDMELIQDAIDACPVTCIHWTDDPGEYAQLNDAQGSPLEDR